LDLTSAIAVNEVEIILELDQQGALVLEDTSSIIAELVVAQNSSVLQLRKYLPVIVE
jgi:hypothetical protein